MILTPNLTFNHNPFDGLEVEEIINAIVPKPFIETIAKYLHNQTPMIIEMVGAKGRGKTTHLRALHYHFSEYPIFLLNAKSTYQTILAHPSPIVFVDSVHHLNFFNRLDLYKKRKLVILTTHWTRILEYKLANQPYKSFKMKGLDKTTLVQIIQNRLLAAVEQNVKSIQIDEQIVDKLLKQYKDNIRGIINHLYTEFQKTYPHE